MSLLRLSARLEAIAKLVPPIGSIADIGTDHGYIPVWLAQNGHKGKLFATDINKEPLQHAIRTAEEYGLSSMIEFYLCDGLAALRGTDVETIVIAGMGGENIAQILEAAAWIKKYNCLLILQPMSKSAYLRSWLFDKGYVVLSEQLVDDSGIYEILTARTGKDEPYSPAELLTGHTRLILNNPLLKMRLDDLISKVERTVTGLSASNKVEDADRLIESKQLLLSLLELKQSIIKE